MHEPTAQPAAEHALVGVVGVFPDVHDQVVQEVVLRKHPVQKDRHQVPTLRVKKPPRPHQGNALRAGVLRQLLDQLAVGLRAQRRRRVRVLEEDDDFVGKLAALHVVSKHHTPRPRPLPVLHVALNRLEQENALLVALLRTRRDARRNRQRDERVRGLAPPLPVHREDLVARVLFRGLQPRVAQEGVPLLVAVQQQIAQFDLAVDQASHVLPLSTHRHPHAQLLRTADLQLEELLFAQRQQPLRLHHVLRRVAQLRRLRHQPLQLALLQRVQRLAQLRLTPFTRTHVRLHQRGGVLCDARLRLLRQREHVRRHDLRVGLHLLHRLHQRLWVMPRHCPHRQVGCQRALQQRVDAALDLRDALQERHCLLRAAHGGNGAAEQLLCLSGVVLAEGQRVLDGGQVLALDGLLGVRGNNNRDRDGLMHLVE